MIIELLMTPGLIEVLPCLSLFQTDNEEGTERQIGVALSFFDIFSRDIMDNQDLKEQWYVTVGALIGIILVVLCCSIYVNFII